jgi:hypothetical protein
MQKNMDVNQTSEMASQYPVIANRNEELEITQS